MKRFAITVALLCGLWPVAAVRAQNTVEYFDRKTGKDAIFIGIILDESPAGIRIKQGTGQPIVIPATDVIHVLYKLDNIKDFVYKAPFSSEKKGLDEKKTPNPVDRRAFLKESLQEFEKLALDLRANPLAYRYVQYRMAVVQVHQARAMPDDTRKMDEAVAALNAFRKEHSGGWEIVPCLKLLAQLQEEKKDLAGAKETYQQLRNVPGVSPELALESSILIAEMLKRGKDFAGAEQALQEVSATLKDDDPLKAKLLVHVAEAQMLQNKTATIEKQLTTVVNNTSDAPVRALAQNILGDYYRSKQQDEDAFWQYLRVDVLYPNDREEHAKALYWLAKLYDSVKKDKIKAQECVEKLKSKDFEGVEYARRMAAETK